LTDLKNKANARFHDLFSGTWVILKPIHPALIISFDNDIFSGIEIGTECPDVHVAFHPRKMQQFHTYSGVGVQPLISRKQTKFHLVWIMDKRRSTLYFPVLPDVWQDIASNLKQVTKHTYALSRFRGGFLATYNAGTRPETPSSKSTCR